MANNQIQWALTRELIKASLARKAKNKLISDRDSAMNDIFHIATALLNAVTASADTRNWLTLPADVKFARIPIEEGEHHITLKTTLRSGKVIEQNHQLIIQKGETALWQTRTFSRTPLNMVKSTRDNPETVGH